MRKRTFEKTVGGKLREGLSGAVPDVWPEIEKAARAADVPEMGAKHSGQKRRLLKVSAAAAAIVICAAVGIWMVPHGGPAIKANAQTVYDNGGRLSNIEASAPPKSFVDSYNNFGLKLLQQTYREESGKNVFQSPASVYLALGMTYNGAKGETAAEFAKVLGSSGSLVEFNNGCAGLQGLLNRRFCLANSIWLNSPFAEKIDGEFLTRDKKSFGASVSTLNLNSRGSADLINKWVKDNTNGRIDPKYDKFDPNTAMLLINTITFKSDWKQKFSANDTRDGSFHSISGDKTVKFMHGMRPKYMEDSTAQGVLLPYDDGKTSMLILLPKKDMNDLLGKLTASSLVEYAAESRESKKVVCLSLPRVNFSTDVLLNDSLEAMGLKLPFGGGADFTGMAAKSANLGLYISKVRHMTYLAIDEKGTEAAAATAVEMDASGVPTTNVMNVDHPFFAAILNDETGAVLFSGIVNDPAVSG